MIGHFSCHRLGAARCDLQLLLTVGVLMGAASLVGPARGQWLLVDDFDGDIQNQLHGYRDAYAAAPSVATVGRTANVFHGEGGRSLQIAATRQYQGFCGAWVHLFDFRAAQPQYFDARPYDYLCFWVRGERGGEQFDVRLADRTWIERDDSVLKARVAELLASRRLTRDWQRVTIPLAEIHNLDLAELGGITFDFSLKGSATVYIDNLIFVKGNIDDDLLTRQVFSQTSAARLRPTELGSRLSRAMWVWTSAEILPSSERRRELIEFCRGQQVNVLWMQVDYEMESAAQGASCRLKQQELWRAFLRDAHQAGIRVHALDGYPEFATSEQHHIPLALVDCIIEYNRNVERVERFAGIHFDNEPYLLVGWADQDRRQEILQQFLDLCVECQLRVRQVDGLEFGVDLPFWWHERDAASNRAIGQVTYGRKTQAASFHCLDHLDNVGVMDYRDSADGPDGLISHARELLAYASQPGKAKVYVGVETSLPPANAVWFLLGMPRDDFRQALQEVQQQIGQHSRWREQMMYTLDDGEWVHIGIGAAKSREQEVAAMLVELARAMRWDRRELTDEDAAFALQQVATRLHHNLEWRNFRTQPLTAARDRPLPAFVLDQFLLPKTTFGDDSWQFFQHQLDFAGQSFQEHASFAGWAIHDYDALRKWAPANNNSSR